MSKRYTEQEKHQILSSFSQRQESVADFSRRCGVSVGSLYKWRESMPTNFHEVVMDIPTTNTTTAAAIGLRISLGAITLEFDPLPPSGYLVTLLNGLGAC